MVKDRPTILARPRVVLLARSDGYAAADELERDGEQRSDEDDNHPVPPSTVGDRCTRRRERVRVDQGPAGSSVVTARTIP